MFILLLPEYIRLTFNYDIENFFHSVLFRLLYFCFAIRLLLNFGFEDFACQSEYWQKSMQKRMSSVTKLFMQSHQECRFVMFCPCACARAQIIITQREVRQEATENCGKLCHTLTRYKIEKKKSEAWKISDVSLLAAPF